MTSVSEPPLLTSPSGRQAFTVCVKGVTVNEMLSMSGTEGMDMLRFLQGWGDGRRGRVSMEAASHGKSSQQASQIPWCPASQPK